MNKKTLLILSGTFVALALWASYPAWKNSVGFMKPAAPVSELSFSSFTGETTEKVVIFKKGEEEKTLLRQNSGWSINSFEASQKSVDGLFETLSLLRVGTLVSKNKENFSDFGVGDDGALLSFSINGKEVAFMIGSRGSSLGSFYARKKDSANVYLVEGKLPDTLSQSVSFWRDKTVVKIPKDAIQKIEIVSATDPLLITQTEDGKWQAENVGKKAVLDETTTKSMLESFDSLEGSDFLTPEQEAEFKKAGGKTILRLFDGMNKKLAEIRFLKKDSDWWATVDGQALFYTVPAYELSDILLTQEQAFGGDKK